MQVERRTFFGRYARWILGFFLLVTPLFVIGAGRAVRSNTNRVEDWLPTTFIETRELVWFRKYFVGDQFVVVGWEGCQLGGDPADPNSQPDDPRIEQLANTLVSPATASNGKSFSHYFKSVTTARRLLNRMTSPPLNVPYREAVERIKGTLVGDDGRQTCVIVTLTNESIHDFQGAIGRGESGWLKIHRPPGAIFAAIEQCGIEPRDAHLGGPPISNVAIDEEGESTLIRLGLLSGLLALALAWWSFRSVRITLIVFSCGLISACLSLALVWATGSRMHAILMSMPPLIYVLAIAGSAHLISYYRAAVLHHGLAGAPEKAIELGWKPTTLCATTTAIGLLSLYTSNLMPIRNFGLFSALGVVTTLGVLFAFLPAALQVWPWHPRKRDLEIGAEEEVEEELDIEPTGFWAVVGRFILRWHYGVAVLCVAFIALVGYGVSHTKSTVDLLELFDSQAPIIRDYKWLESHVSKLVPMELVVRFPKPLLAAVTTQATVEEESAPVADDPSRLSLLERMEVVALVEQVVDHYFGKNGTDVIGHSMSVMTFAPPLPSSRGDVFSFARRTATNSKLESHLGEYLTSGYLAVDELDGAELWRVSLRVAAFKNVDYGQFVEHLRQVVEPVLAAHGTHRAILRELLARHKSDGYAGASVCLVDAPRVATTKAGEIDEHHIYAAALKELQRRSRIKVTEVKATGQEPLPTLVGRLSQADCVVLVQDVGEVVENAIRVQVPVVLQTPELVPPQLSGELPEVGHIADATQDDVSTVYTGVVPIVYKAERTLLESLIQSTLWSFLTITPLMMFVARGIGPGIVAMLPNALPVLVVFGGMGWLDIDIDIGSMMTASIALGVAVDDTIHFLTWFRRELKRRGNRKEAILATYRHCATPTLQAAMISGLGLSVFAFSTFVPTQKFGFLMLTILFAGVAAELIFFPAILAGPLGLVFREIDPQQPSRWTRWRDRIRRLLTSLLGGDMAMPETYRGGGTASSAGTLEASPLVGPEREGRPVHLRISGEDPLASPRAWQPSPIRHTDQKR